MMPKMFRTDKDGSFLKSRVFDDLVMSRDAAPPSLFTESAQVRAQARKEQIMATSPAEMVPAKTFRRSSQSFLRWVAIPLAAAAIIAVRIASPHGAGVQTALANWTPTPTSVTEPALSQTNSLCQTQISHRIATAEHGWSPP